MKIIVSVKQVPSRDANLRVASGAKWLDESDLRFEINEPDAYALEEALQLKEKLGGEVVVLCAGPERAGQTIREALAKGADRAIHVQVDASQTLDSFLTARLLSEAIKGEAPDLILTGLQSDDLGYGQTGVIMAELLGWPHATIVMEVEPIAEGIRVKRELEDGWFQHVTLPLPSVLTIQSGIKKLRYATLMGIKKAKSKEIRIVDVASLGIQPAGADSLSLDRVYTPERRKSSQLFTGDARQAASQLVEKLRFEARVL
jgi:electron transfer flavoprotein beta subunit